MAVTTPKIVSGSGTTAIAVTVSLLFSKIVGKLLVPMGSTTNPIKFIFYR